MCMERRQAKAMCMCVTATAVFLSILCILLAFQPLWYAPQLKFGSRLHFTMKSTYRILKFQ